MSIYTTISVKKQKLQNISDEYAETHSQRKTLISTHKSGQ